MLKTLLSATTAFAESLGHDHTGETTSRSKMWNGSTQPIPGVQLAQAWGDDATGTTWLFKMDPGIALAMHTHTNDYWGLSIAGNWVHIEGDGTEVPTVPGDYSLLEGGVVHADRCDSDIPCIGLLAFTGPRDVALAE